MSFKLTESWIQFSRATIYSCPHGVSAPVDSTFKWSPNAWVVCWGGYYAAQAGATALRCIADPIFPLRNRLVLCSSSHYGSFSISKADTSEAKRRFGFLINMRPATRAQMLAFGAGNLASRAGRYEATHPIPTDFQSVISFYKAASSTVVNLSHSAGGVATVLSFALETNKDYYIEVEMDTNAGTYRVWVDDYLLVDAAMSAAAKTAMKSSWGWHFGGPNQSESQIYDIAYLSDIYYLIDDGIAPAARLGKTTRVKGELPSGEVSVGFDRPSGATSNYDVINDGVASANAPTVFLTGSGVGVKDVYSVPAETYAAQVYAMSVKTIVANFSASAHGVSAVIADADSSATSAMGTLAAGSPFVPLAAAFTTDPDGNPWTPAAAAACNFGLQVTS